MPDRATRTVERQDYLSNRTRVLPFATFCKERGLP